MIRSISFKKRKKRSAAIHVGVLPTRILAPTSGGYLDKNLFITAQGSMMSFTFFSVEVDNNNKKTRHFFQSCVCVFKLFPIIIYYYLLGKKTASLLMKLLKNKTVKQTWLCQFLEISHIFTFFLTKQDYFRLLINKQ